MLSPVCRPGSPCDLRVEPRSPHRSGSLAPHLLNPDVVGFHVGLRNAQFAYRRFCPLTRRVLRRHAARQAWNVSQLPSRTFASTEKSSSPQVSAYQFRYGSMPLRYLTLLEPVTRAAMLTSDQHLCHLVISVMHRHTRSKPCRVSYHRISAQPARNRDDVVDGVPPAPSTASSSTSKSLST